MFFSVHLVLLQPTANQHFLKTIVSSSPQTEIPGQIALTAEEHPSPGFYYPPSHVNRRASLPKLVSTLEPQAVQVTSPTSTRRPSTAGPQSVSLAPPMFPGDYRFSPVETVPQRPHVLPPLRTSTRPPKLSDIPWRYVGYSILEDCVIVLCLY